MPRGGARELSGEILGKQVIVYGEQSHPSAPQRYHAPGGSLFTSDMTEVFRARTAPFSLDSIVVAAATLTGMRARNESWFVSALRAMSGTRATFHPTVVRRVVTRAIVERQLPDTADLVITTKEFESAELAAISVQATADQFLDGADPNLVWASVMRIAQYNAHDQSRDEAYARELWLNRIVIEKAAALDVDVDAAYRKEFGLTYSELAMLSFAAYVELIDEGSAGTLERNNWRLGAALFDDPKIASAFFELVSLDYADFKKRAAHPDVVEEGFETYALSPVVRWPLIILSSGRCAAPVADDLLDRPTRGFPIDVQQALQQSPSDYDVVKQVTSSAYEDYVEELLRTALPQATIYRGRDVLPQDRFNCDFVCVEGRLVTLVEAKAVHIRLKTGMTKDYNLLREEFDRKGVGKGLAQLSESARAIRERVTPFAKNSILTGLVVVRGEQVFMNSLRLRSIIEELAVKETGRHIPLKYQVVNDDGLSLLARLAAARGGLGRILREKLGAPGELQADFEDWISQRRTPEMPPLSLHKQQRAGLKALIVEMQARSGPRPRRMSP